MNAEVRELSPGAFLGSFESIRGADLEVFESVFLSELGAVADRMDAGFRLRFRGGRTTWAVGGPIDRDASRAPVDIGYGGGARVELEAHGVGQSELIAIADSVSEVLNAHASVYRRKWLGGAFRLLVEEDFGPQACLNRLAIHLKGVFPNLSLFSGPADHVQILTPDLSLETLTIRGTTGTEQGSRVYVSNSVVGLVLQTDGADGPGCRIFDPQDESIRDRYRGWADQSRNVRSELVMVLQEKGTTDIIGALNFESYEVDAFGAPEAALLTSLTPHVAALVLSLGRLDTNERGAIESSVAALSNYLASARAITKHEYDQHSVAVGLTLGAIGRIANGIEQVETRARLQAEIGEVLEEHGKMLDVSDTLFASLSDSDPGSSTVDVAEIVDSAVEVFEKRGPQVDEKLIFIRINERPTQPCIVQGNRILLLFLSSVLRNSRTWVQASDCTEGRIDLAIRRSKAVPTNREPILNQTVILEITDNGCHAPLETIDAVNRGSRYVKSGHNGSGIALLTLGTYVRSCGGSLVVRNNDDTGGFTVVIELVLKRDKV